MPGKRTKSESEQDSGKVKRIKTEEELEKKSKKKAEKVEKKEKKKEKKSSESEASGSESGSETETSEFALSNFRISKESIQNLESNGIKQLFPIQAQTFNPIYDGKDVIGQARTGSGKTISFSLPILEKMFLNPPSFKRGRSPTAIIMAPTRELAKQIEKEIQGVIGTRKIAVCCIYGGAQYEPQEYALKNGIDILVGTPGRIIDHLERGTLVLDDVKYVVLDEADRMLEVGFSEAIEQILSSLYKDNSKPQTLLFSATMPKWVRDTSRKYLAENKITVNLIGKDENKTSQTIQHLALKCSYYARASTIADVVQVYSGAHGRTIIFTSTKKEATELALNSSIKQECQALHGDIPQKQREITLQSFREGKVRCLVATDVAARGLDIPEVDLVIQTEVPEKVEDYIHRAGRTGRAGKSGICILFYKPKEDSFLKHIENHTGLAFKRIGAPQPIDIIKASAKDAIRFLDRIPEDMIEHFKSIAEELIESKGAVAALSAALAHISGNTDEIKRRSLLSSDENYTTCYIQVQQEIRGLGYFWSILERLYSAQFKDLVRGMRMTKDKMGAVFDIPTEKEEHVKSGWKDSATTTLTFPSVLPELDDTGFEAAAPARSGGYRSGGFGRNRSGGNSYGGGRGSGGSNSYGGGRNGGGRSGGFGGFGGRNRS